MKPITKKFLMWIGICSAAFVAFWSLVLLEIISNPIINMSFRYSDTKVESKFEGVALIPEIKYLQYNNRQVRYLLLKTSSDLPFVVFIHGAPGSSADYLNYFKDKKLNKKVNLISVDRPGYGYSNYGLAETSIRKQAAAIHEVVKRECGDRSVVLVGHSYGGPIALRIAADFPISYHAAILLAPAIDPKNEKKIKIASFGTNKFSGWLIPPAMQVAAYEKITHVEELKKLEPLIENIQVPVYHIHGTNDSLVPFENVAFAKNHIRDSLLHIKVLQNVDHFLPWSHHKLVVDKILESIENQAFGCLP
jgi:pimeloyl-ACP methyl ester carboxylesterase